MSQHPTRSRECLWLAALCALQLMAATPALACTCFLSREVVWPQAGTSVSADTAIVISTAGDETLLTGDVVLRGSDGTEIALERVEKLPRSLVCEGDLVFFRPAPELTSGMKYEVTVRRKASTPPDVVKFSTHEKTQRPQAATKPKVTYLSVAQHPDCEEGQCYDLAEVHVELEHKLHELAWLQIRSTAQRFQNNRWELSPKGGFLSLSDLDETGQPKRDPEREAQISVPLSPNDPCVDIAIYGIDGRVLFEERRCKPDRCAVYKQRHQSTCGEPPRSGLDATRLSPTSCDDPPVLDKENWYPDFDAGTRDAAADPEEEQVRLRTKPAPSCQASPPTAASDAPWPLALFTAAGLLLHRRRRSRASQ